MASDDLDSSERLLEESRYWQTKYALLCRRLHPRLVADMRLAAEKLDPIDPELAALLASHAGAIAASITTRQELDEILAGDDGSDTA